MLLVIDNYDSFTFNLVQYFGELGVEQCIKRNDEIDAAGVAALKPERILVSPGPCSPNEAGNSIAIIDHAVNNRIPLFGVCLGHQCIGQYFGGHIIGAKALMHGKTSPVYHKGTDLFAGIPSPFKATRYHSLAINPATVPACLEVTAHTEDGEIMGVRHISLPVWGVQFHPESLATEHGMTILCNFLALH